MKRVFTVLTVGIVLTVALTGCAAKEGAVAPAMQLDMVQLLETAQTTKAPNLPEAADAAQAAQPLPELAYINLPLGQRLEIPAAYTADITSKDGKLHMTANASIQIPNADAMPLARVARSDFQLDEIKLLLEGLFGDAPLYWNDWLDTKAKTAEAYAGLMEHQATNGDRLTPVQRENVKNSLKRYEAILAVMPDDDLLEPWNGELSQETPIMRAYQEYPRPNDANVSVDVLNLTDVQARGRLGTARACIDVRGTENGYTPFLDYYHVLEPDPATPVEWAQWTVSIGSFSHNREPAIAKSDLDRALGSMHLTPKDAIGLADKLLEPFSNVAFYSICHADNRADDMQIEDVGTVDVPATMEAYILTYTPEAADVEGIYIDGAAANLSGRKEGEPPESWGYPSIQIAVNDDGILALRWLAPAENDAVLVHDATLLTYPEMISVFENMIFVTYDGWSKGAEIQVDSMRLGLMRVHEKDNMQDALLVPAWSFYGRFNGVTEEGQDVTRVYGEGQPMLIINAVDGSVIDPYTV